MKLPRYLIIMLVVTVALVLWSQLDVTEEPEQFYNVATSQKIKKTNKTGIRKIQDDVIVDLFPVLQKNQPEKTENKSLDTVKKIEPVFPLQVVGAWWEKGQKVVILSDGELNILLCKNCKTRGYTTPGKEIISSWKLVALADDHLVVEWQPEKILKRIELGDLTSKPAQ